MGDGNGREKRDITPTSDSDKDYEPSEIDEVNDFAGYEALSDSDDNFSDISTSSESENGGK